MSIAITVSELIQGLKKIERKGKGDYMVFISNDDIGCNGFHPCIGNEIGFPVPADELQEEDRQFFEEDTDGIRDVNDKKKVVYLG